MASDVALELMFALNGKWLKF